MMWVKYLKDTVFDPDDSVPIGKIELVPGFTPWLVRVDQKGVVPWYDQHLLVKSKLIVIVINEAQKLLQT